MLHGLVENEEGRQQGDDFDKGEPSERAHHQEGSGQDHRHQFGQRSDQDAEADRPHVHLVLAEADEAEFLGLRGLGVVGLDDADAREVLMEVGPHARALFKHTGRPTTDLTAEPHHRHHAERIAEDGDEQEAQHAILDGIGTDEDDGREHLEGRPAQVAHRGGDDGLDNGGVAGGAAHQLAHIATPMEGKGLLLQVGKHGVAQIQHHLHAGLRQEVLVQILREHLQADGAGKEEEQDDQNAGSRAAVVVGDGDAEAFEEAFCLGKVFLGLFGFFLAGFGQLFGRRGLLLGRCLRLRYDRHLLLGRFRGDALFDLLRDELLGHGAHHHEDGSPRAAGKHA